MTWLDERLFGWSKSAHRGTNAWSGTPEEGSRIPTPEDTDEEDAGDYDNVLGMLSDETTISGQKMKSRQSSFADLQRLRFTPTDSQSHRATTTALDAGSPGGSIEHRSRRPSLSDNVVVKKIAMATEKESFAAATNKLNTEILKGKNGQDSTL